MHRGWRALLAGLAAIAVLVIGLPAAGIVLLLAVGPHSSLLPQRSAEIAAPILALVLLIALLAGAARIALAVWHRSSGTRASPD